MTVRVEIDVALVPAAAGGGADVAIVVDQVRASTTITTLLDAPCGRLRLAGSLGAARVLARETGSLLVGERGGVRPRGFDFDNSPTALSRAPVAGRDVVLTTTNGTAVLRRCRRVPRVLVGCTRNAGACAAAAIRLAADEMGDTVGGHARVVVVCAGLRGRFTIEDAVAAGSIVRGMTASAADRGVEAWLTDGARAALHLRDAFPDLALAMSSSDGGRALRQLGRDDDLAFCAGEDLSATVPLLRDGDPMEIVRLER